VSEPVSIWFSGQQMWQVEVTLESSGASIAQGLAGFYLPDPNLHGNESVKAQPVEGDAQALFEMGSERLSGLHRIKYTQWFSDGLGLAVVSFHTVTDDQDGGTAFTYFTPGGLDAVVIGTDLWSRKGDKPWEKTSTNPSIPPSQWINEYKGATNFQLGPVVELPQGPCQFITFVVPETESQSVAWYSWCVDTVNGDLFRDLMVSRTHFMTSDFYDQNGDFEILPPVDAP
jgi:hypothetical protein